MDKDLLQTNRLGIKTPEKLRAAEYDYSAAREAEFRRAGAALPLSFDGLKQAHKTLFQDVYPWAGQVRAVNITRHVARNPLELQRGGLKRATHSNDQGDGGASLNGYA